MSDVKKILEESMAGNPEGLREAFAAALATRIAEAVTTVRGSIEEEASDLEEGENPFAKKDDDDKDDDDKDGDDKDKKDEDE